MKVQSSKVESQNQASTSTDLASPSQADVPLDFFSTIIANLLATPIAQTSDEEDAQTSDLSEQQENTSDQTCVMGAQPSLSSHPADELMANLLAASGKESQRISAQSEETGADTEQNKITIPQDIQIQQRMMKNIDTQVRDKSDSEVQIPINIPSEAMQSLMVNEKPKKLFNYQEVDTSQSKLNRELLRLSESEESINDNYAIANDNQAKVISDQAMTVFSLQKGQINYPDEQKNKYVDALVQMSGMINGQAGAMNKSEQWMATGTQATGQVDYTDIMKTVHQPEYELIVEVLPQSLDAFGKEAYNANIKIHPPELGAVIAKLKIDKNSAELVIVAENSRVKEVIEANLLQLRENFQKHDINITQIHINVQNPQAETNQHEHKQQRPQENVEDNMRDTDVNKSIGVKKDIKHRLDSLVDTYA